MRRVQHERSALLRIAAHVHEPLQGVRPERRDQQRRALAQGLDLGGRRGPELTRDLQQVTDDDLIVGSGAVALLDRPGDIGGIGRKRRAVGRFARHDRGACEADPQFRGARTPASAAAGAARTVADERQLVERQGMQPEMRPVGKAARAQAQRSFTLGIGRQQPHRVADFDHFDATHDADRAQVMTMKAFSQAAQQRLIRVGGVALDDQLPPGDAKRDHRSIGQQSFGATGDRLNSRVERGVATRVHRVLVQGHGELHEELAQLARQRDSIGLDRVHGVTARSIGVWHRRRACPLSDSGVPSLLEGNGGQVRKVA